MKNCFVKTWLAAFLGVAVTMGALPSFAGTVEAVTVTKLREHNQPFHDALLELAGKSDAPLSRGQLTQYKSLLKRFGWPTVAVVGMDGVDAAGRLLLRASDDYAYQQSVLSAAGERMGKDINALGWMRLNDEIQVQKDGGQQYGTLFRLEHSAVLPVPRSAEKVSAGFWRDFNGLPTEKEQQREVARKVAEGKSLAQANPRPPFAQPFNGYTRPEIRESLGRMIEADQTTRNALMQATGAARKRWNQVIEKVDKANLVKIKAIFDEVGFPTPAMVGRDGVSTAFLLVQHADNDRAFQEKALRLAKPLVDRHEMARLQYAYLVDRVSLARGKPQIYGSQYHLVGGKMVPNTIADPQHLDARRESMALEPEAKYLEFVQKQYDQSPAGKARAAQSRRRPDVAGSTKKAKAAES